MRAWRPWIARIALAALLALTVHLTLFRYAAPGARPNLVPLRTIRHDVGAGGDEFRVNIVGNLGLFALYGFLLPTAIGRRGSSGVVVGICLALSAGIEGLQWRSGVRVADVDDLILNGAGGAIGWLAWRLGRWWFAPDPPAQKA